MNTVIVHFDQHGELSYFVNGKKVRLLIVDERAPNDRVYEWLPRCSASDIAQIVPASSPIGSNKDARHKAVKARVKALQSGKPHLDPVK